ncbi:MULTISPECIES: AraC family transcriptional regulator [Pseudomonadaceae]|uniref:AraC family transcriptional regulator n=1 Tax=Ectopseudomonas toyotomiensis TaxID=554344 RepID=A0A1I5Q2T7_9GAMM|nr:MULTISPECIES: AraC family transcriptional regulator [Pseudomonas]MBG0843275.1 AraC family transcriptional regulator [Pseudomonas toyotomiensis]PIA73354.1 AraC family transcriptional regulator [Pseudomonas toyotomiensis]QSL91009.1 AraC family transcriptional regulator [Pseudomonas toyotomiensis]SDA51071.1 transcriptional regulator, AraC family [Pseudomonas sp. NFPP33]SFP40176.1 transcriptional regulator, AraC family [Pseudomonas toyotomiensis]
MRDLTDDVALMRPVIDALRASGTDPDRVLVRVGLPPGGLPAGRFPHAAQAAFWKAASEECGEEHVGLYLAQHLPAFHGLLLEYLFLSSETFGVGLRHALRYVRLLSDTLSARLDVDGDMAVLTLGVEADTPRHFPEMLAGAVIRLFAALTENDFRPREVRFMHAEGASAERYQAVYGCPVRLGAEDCALVFDAAVLDKASRHAAPELLRMHESLARRQLAEVERLDLVRQVRELIAELLVNGGATLEQVAARLNMPARRLRERLAMAGVRFNDLITDYRCRLAKELLLKTDERIEVIVERTGFSEPSTFYRAFKRWVGETPVEFRKRGKM